ncbi:MAG: hypothetical protein CXT78_09760 [Thaumarchaeota archaeon]|jgi:hypothetical protein|nr:MAG: hypothetical protein CXT78_09760 [Nitrososphaerota archaeon]
MNQECEFFHTEKKWESAKEILSKNGVEIFFKEEYAHLSIDELTDEERKAWKKENMHLLPDLLPKLKKASETIQKNIEVISQFTSLVGKPQVTVEDWLNLAPLYEQISSLQSDLTPFSYFERKPDRWKSENISCNIIIGQKNGNLVRFLEFNDNDDPVVTITGNSALSLKSEIEEQFV